MNSIIVSAVYSAWVTILRRQAVLAVVLSVCIGIKYGAFTASLWLLGLALGVFDSFLTFRGIRKGMQKSIKESVAVMHRTMLVRISVLFFFSFVMLKLGFNVLGVALGFILMHIFLLINLIIIANRNLKNVFVKKGE